MLDTTTRLLTVVALLIVSYVVWMQEGEIASLNDRLVTLELAERHRHTRPKAQSKPKMKP